MSEVGMAPKTRREVLGLIGGAAAALFVAGCAGGSGASGATKSTSARASTTTTTGAPATTTTTAPAATLASCAPIPEETAGPFPGDGTNGPNVLTQNGVVRSDIRSSFGSGSGVASGLPLTVDLTIVDTKNGCKALSDAAVYIWHCDQNGLYSMYGQGVTGENYLRGVQVTDANGAVRFTSIFPAAYSGRWPHVHFEVYPSLADATSASNKLRTSQLALPEDVCKQVYEADGYEESLSNLSQTSLDSDNVFSDGYSLQMPRVTGSNDEGYVATLNVPV